MADVKNVVTLGIGASPGNISFFLLLGLGIEHPPAPACRTYIVPAESRMFTMPRDSRTWTLASENRTYKSA